MFNNVKKEKYVKRDLPCRVVVKARKSSRFVKKGTKKNWCKNAEMQASSMRMQTVER